MQRKLVMLSVAVFFAAAAQASAIDDVRVKLQPIEGRDRVVQGTRVEVSNTAEKFALQGEYESARLCYLRLIETDPGDSRSMLLLGQLYQFKLGKYPDAIHMYKRAERAIPESNAGGRAFVWRLSADAYRDLAEKTNSLIYFVQAISEYEKILDHFDPKDSEVMYNIASCRLNSRDYEGAIEWFKRVLVLDPKGELAEMTKKALEIAERENREKRARDR